MDLLPKSAAAAAAASSKCIDFNVTFVESVRRGGEGRGEVEMGMGMGMGGRLSSLDEVKGPLALQEANGRLSSSAVLLCASLVPTSTCFHYSPSGQRLSVMGPAAAGQVSPERAAAAAAGAGGREGGGRGGGQLRA